MTLEVAYLVFTPTMNILKDGRVSNGKTNVVIKGPVETQVLILALFKLSVGPILDSALLFFNA